MGIAIGNLIADCKDTFVVNDSLKNKRLGVDAYNILYQFITNIRGIDGQPLKNDVGKITSHLNGLFYRMLNLLSTGAKFTFVFDGESHELKHKTKQERRDKRTIAKDKFDNATQTGNLEDMQKYAKQFASLDEDIIKESKELLNAMGISYINAPSEAEAQISYMTQNNQLDYTVSSDFDCLLFGSPNLVRNLTVSGKKKIPYKNIYLDVLPEIIRSECVFNKLNINREKLIWLSMLIGTDFNDKIEGVGPKTALKLVKEYDSFDQIKNYLESKNKTFTFDYKEIENIFSNPNVDKNPKVILGEFNKSKIQEILINKANFSEERVKSAIDRFITEKDEKDKQKSISQWF